MARKLSMTDTIVDRPELVSIEVETLPDESPDTSYLEQEGFEDALASYRNGDFGFIGIRARAVIRVPHGSASILQDLYSPGLWGIEDNSSDKYVREVYAEERATLVDILRSLNVAGLPH